MGRCFLHTDRKMAKTTKYLYRVQSSVWRRTTDPPPPLHPSECVLPPAPREGVHTRRAVRGWGGQYFGRRQTLYNPSTAETYRASQRDQQQQILSQKESSNSRISTKRRVNLANAQSRAVQQTLSHSRQSVKNRVATADPQSKVGPPRMKLSLFTLITEQEESVGTRFQ